MALSNDGKVALIGAPDENQSTGAAYLFQRSGSVWATSHSPVTLTVAGLLSSSYLGCAVALSQDGSVAVLGAYDATSADNKAVPSAYVFVRPKNGWKSTSTPNATLTFNGNKLGSELGFSVAVAHGGKVIAVGAQALNGNSGKVFLYGEGNGWSGKTLPAATLSAPNTMTFGYVVAISGGGSEVLVGTSADNTGHHGGAYLYVRNGTSWHSMTNPTAKLSASTASTSAELGASVGLSGDGKTAMTGSLGDPMGISERFTSSSSHPPRGSRAPHPRRPCRTRVPPVSGIQWHFPDNGAHAVIGRYSPTGNADPNQSAFLYNRPSNGWHSLTSYKSALVTQAGSTTTPAVSVAGSLTGNGKVYLGGLPYLGRGGDPRQPACGRATVNKHKVVANGLLWQSEVVESSEVGAV